VTLFGILIALWVIVQVARSLFGSSKPPPRLEAETDEELDVEDEDSDDEDESKDDEDEDSDDDGAEPEPQLDEIAAVNVRDEPATSQPAVVPASAEGSFTAARPPLAPLSPRAPLAARAVQPPHPPLPPLAPLPPHR
jgi:hypothetical protein